MPGEPYYVLSIRQLDPPETDEEEWSDATSYYYYTYTQGNCDSKEENEEYVIFIDLKIAGASTVNAADINLIYDSNILQPVHESYTGSKKNKVYSLKDAGEFENPDANCEMNFAEVEWEVPVAKVNGLDTSKKSIRISGATSGHLTDGQVVATLMFKLKPGYKIDNIPSSAFHLEPVVGLSQGLQICYYPVKDVQTVEGENYLKFEGFEEEEEKKVTGIEVKNQMTKGKYDDGEELDFEGAEIEITYEGGTKEQMPLKEAIEKKLVTVDQEHADVHNSKVTITGGDSVTAELEYKVVKEIKIDKNPTDTTYKHGDSIDFSGGEVTLVYDDESEEKIDMKTGIDNGTFTPSTDTADIDNKRITLDYKDGSLSDQFDITVYDPITKIEMANDPTKVEYNHQETIQKNGGKIKITRRSGRVELVDLNDVKVSIDETQADINRCTNKYDINGGQAGTQTITVTYTEQDEDNQDVTETTSFTILVNDTIQSIKVTKQPEAKNKWGTELNSLDLSGAELTITTQSGHTYTTPVIVGMLKPEEYHNNTLAEQKITVQYNGKETTEDANKLKIQLKDYVESIELKNTGDSTEYYGTKLEDADFIDEITYLEHYASGSVAEHETPITDGMVGGYEKEPAASLFDSQHKCKETLTLTVTDVDEFNTEVTAQFDITIKDVVTGIEVANRPGKVVYKYGDTFNAGGGRIKFHWASGAEDTGYGIEMTEESITISYLDDHNNDPVTDLRPAASDFENGVAKKTLLVTYRDEQNLDHHGYIDREGQEVKATFEITIKDVISSVEVKGTPKGEFEYGDELELGDGVTVEVTYQSGAKREVGIDDVEILDATTNAQMTTSPRQEEYDHLEPPDQLTKKAKIKYTEGENSVESDTYDITIKDTVQSIAVTKPPTNVEYEVNENPWKLEGGEVTITRKSGRLEVLELSSDKLDVQAITEVTNTAGPQKEVTVTYKEELDGSKPHTATFKVNVKDVVKSITITDNGVKKNYNYGENLEYNNIDIYVKYASTPEGNPGTKVTVNPDWVKDITGGGDGVTPTTSLQTNDFSDEGIHSKYKAERTLKLTYEEGGQSKDLTFNIYVYNNVDHIKIKEGNEPKDKYLLHEEPVYPDGKIEIYRKADSQTSVETANIEKAMVSNLDTEEEVTGATAKVTYTEKGANAEDKTAETTYKYDVGDGLTGVEVKQKPTKLQYNWGDTLNLTGMNFINHYASRDDTITDISSIKDKIKIIEIDNENAETSLAEFEKLEPALSEFKDGHTLTKRIKVKYELDDKTAESEIFEIVIKDNVSEVHFGTKPDNLTYNVGDSSWDLTASDGTNGNADIIIEYQSGATEVVELTEEMLPDLSDLTTEVAEQKEVTVTYTENDKDNQPVTTTFQIKVVDEISTITVEGDMQKLNYDYGEQISYDGLSIKIEYVSGNQETVAITEATKKDITDSEPGEDPKTDLDESKFVDEDNHSKYKATRTIKISYDKDSKHGEKEVQINIYNTIVKIEIDDTNKPKQKYEVSEEQPNLDGKIKIFRKANENVATEEVDVTPEMVTGLSTDREVTQAEATIKYKETYPTGTTKELQTTYKYDVGDGLQGVKVEGSLTNTDYNWGDTLDLDGLTFTDTYSSGDRPVEDLESIKDKITILEVKDGEDEKELDWSLKPSVDELGSSHKVTKKVKVKYTVGDKSTESAEFTITITDNMESIEMGTQPDKKTYKLNETDWDLTAKDDQEDQTADIIVTYQSGATETVKIEENMLSPEITELTSSTGHHKVTVKYGHDKEGAELETEFYIDVEDGISSVTINTDAFTKNEYNYEEEVDFSQITITVQNASGTSQNVDISQATIKDITKGKPGKDVTTELAEEEFTTDNKSERRIEITYTPDGGEHTATKEVTITVFNIVDHIVITQEPKNEYNLGDSTTSAGGKITIYRKANPTVSSEQKDIEDAWITNLSTANAGNYQATVTYTEQGARHEYVKATATYNYKVKDTINKQEITGDIETDYEYGDDLDLSGLQLKTDYNSGSSQSTPIDKSHLKVEDITDSDSDPKPLQTPFKPSAEEFEKSQDHKVHKKVKVTYTDDEGNTTTREVEITISDVIEKVEMLHQPDNTTYNVNETDWKLDASSGKDGKADIKVTYKSGRTETVKIEEDMLSPDLETLTSETGTDKTVTVTYTDPENPEKQFTTTFEIDVEDSVESVTIEGSLTNADYNYGEAISYDGIIIYVKHASDSNPKGKPVDITKATIEDVTDSGSTIKPPTTSLTKDKFNSATHKAQRQIKITYTEDGQTDSETYTINVLNTLHHIKIADSPNTSYQLNDETTGAGGTINIYRSADVEHPDEVKDIEDEWITNLKTDQIGTFTATVTYTENDIHEKEIKGTDTYEYTVSDTVQSIELDPEPTKKDYLYGDKLDLKDGRLKVTKKNGTIEYVDLTDLPAGSITGFNGSPDPETVTFPYQETITVTYGNLENGEPAKVTFTVTINDYVKDIILTPPNKKEYQYGERQLDLIGGSVQAVMASGKTTSPVGLDNGEVQLSQFDPEAIGSQEIKVTYKGITKSFFVTIIDEITSIKIKETPKQDYKYGEKLDVKGGTIEVTTKSGRVQDIPITESMVKGYDPNKLGEQELTVTYEGQTTTYTVEVKDYVAKIEIVKPNKLVYNIGETMNLAGGKVIVIMASGITKSPIDMTSDMISGFDTSTEGSKRITVTYEGMKATFSITVVDPLSDVVIKTLPNKTEYKYGEKLDLTGGTIELRKQSGATQTVPMNESMVSGYNPNKLGTQTLTVTYEGQFVGTFDVEVKDYVSKLIVTPPSKTKYEYGENIDLKGGYVSIVMASGAVEEKVPMTSSMISGYNSTKEGIQNIQVEYKGLQGSFQVTVVDEIKGIEMNTNPDKVDYKYGQKLNVAGATIKVHKSSGTYIVSVTDDMVSGYNAKQPGTQSITVKYGGFETNFAVTVAKKPASAPKPSTPKPSTPEVQEPTVQEPEVQEPQVQEPEVQKPTVQEPEKPTEVLGVQDENKGDSGKVLAGCMCIIGLLFLLILIVFKRNVKVYVFEDGEYVLGGRDKITKKDPSLDIDKFLDGDTYANPVKIVLSDSISEKLDGKVIEIKHRGKTIKHTVKYNDEEYEFILE